MSIDLLQSFGSGAIAGTAVVFLAREWISTRIKESIMNEYAMKFHAYKTEVEQQNTIEVERLRNNLHLMAAEHQVKFSGLHEKRAETLAGTFERLHHLQRSVALYVAIDGDLDGRDSRRDACNQSLGELVAYFFPREIYLPSDVAERTATAIQRIRRVANDWSIWVHNENAQVKAGIPREPKVGQVWDESAVAINQEIPALLRDMAGEYRRQLEPPGAAAMA
jgi:hypothetical protein